MSWLSRLCVRSMSCVLWIEDLQWLGCRRIV
jgi:hypothetical protein